MRISPWPPRASKRGNFAVYTYSRDDRTSVQNPIIRLWRETPYRSQTGIESSFLFRSHEDNVISSSQLALTFSVKG